MFHILVVDDDKNTRMYFEAVLKNNGYTVTVAKNGEDAPDAMDKGEKVKNDMDDIAFTEEELERISWCLPKLSKWIEVREPNKKEEP